MRPRFLAPCLLAGVSTLLLLPEGVRALPPCWDATRSTARFSAFEAIPGQMSIQVEGIAGDGVTVVGRLSTPSSQQSAFRWTATSGTELLEGLPGGGNSIALAASRDGSVIVGEAFDGPTFKPVRWTLADGVVPLATASGAALDVTPDGSRIVGMQDFAGFRPVYWNENDEVTVIDFSGTGCIAFRADRVSADGSVTMGYAECGGQNMMFYRTEGVETLFFPEFSSSFDMSTDGSTLVGDFRSDRSPFIWTIGAGFEAPGSLRFGVAVSADGSVVVGDLAVATGAIWGPGSETRELRELLVNEFGVDLGGLALNTPQAISDDGCTVAGDEQNHNQSWVVTVPEPTPVASALAALCTLALIRYRAR